MPETPPAYRRLALFLTVVCLFGAVGCASQTRNRSHTPVSPTAVIFPHEWKGVFDQMKLAEPSGAVIHPDRGTLFIVDDEGSVAELKRDGTVVQEKLWRQGADLEGITCDPRTGLLYLVEEGKECIYEVTPDDFKLQRTFAINRYYHDKLRMHPGGNGIEGITFVPNPTDPEGGTFVVAHQSFTLDDPEEPSALMRVEAPCAPAEATSLKRRSSGCNSCRSSTSAPCTTMATGT